MRIALISGASSGIGKCIAQSLDNYCLDEIWLIGRSYTKLEGLKSILYTKAKIFTLDLQKEESYKKISDALNENSCEIQFLVCSAGVGYNGMFKSITCENISEMISINCTGLTLLTKIALPFMKKGSSIINIASGAGFLPQPSFAVYSASKSYVISFSRALRQELSKKKINVTAVCPGPVDTDFFANLKNVKEYKKKYLITPEIVASGALKAVKKNKAIYTPTFSMKLVHLASKILPTSLILKLMK